MTEKQKIFQEKCIAFSVRCIQLHKELIHRKEYNLSDQLERAATSIGAQYSEAVYAESDADLIHKLQIGQKEANETIYWLKLLVRSEWISQDEYDSLLSDVEEIMRILSAILIAVKKRNSNS